MLELVSAGKGRGEAGRGEERERWQVRKREKKAKKEEEAGETHTHTHRETHTERHTQRDTHRETHRDTHKDTQRRHMSFSSQFHKSLCSLKDSCFNIDSAKLRFCYSWCEFLFVSYRYACVSTHVFLSSKLCRVASSAVMLLRTPSNDSQVELRVTKFTLFRDRHDSYVSACTNCSKNQHFLFEHIRHFCF